MEKIEKLIDLFDKLSVNSISYKQKSENLSLAKMVILNELTNDQIIDFFVDHKTNFENLFLLNIWTKSLETSGGSTEFLEPYDIIEKIFSCFNSLQNLLNKFQYQLLFLIIQEQDEKVKHISIQNLTRLVQLLDASDFKMDTLKELENDLKDVLPCLVSQIPQTAISYSHLLGDLFCHLTSKFNELNLKLNQNQDLKFHDSIFSFENSALIKEFENVMQKNSVLNLRVLEIIIKLSSLSENHLNEIGEAKFGLASKINSILRDKFDVLSQLNCIELLTNFISSNHGYNYLEQSGHLNFLYCILTGSEQNPFADFLIPQVLKFFAQIARNLPQNVNDKFPDFYKFLFEKSNEQNNVTIKLVIETFNFLFESNLVKKFIFYNYETQFINLMQKLLNLVQFSSNHEIKSLALTCISEIVSCDPSLLNCYDSNIKWSSSPLIHEYSEFCHLLYSKLTIGITSENLFGICLKLAKQPFPETRLAAQLYFKALAQSKWGLVILFESNKFNSAEEFVNGYLLNRSIELEKQSLESKYELIKLIVTNYKSNVDLFHVIGNSNLAKFEEYLKQGPFYAGAQHAVSFESA